MFFKKKKVFKDDRGLNEMEKNFLISLTNKLAFKFPLLKKQIENKGIIGISIDPLRKKGGYIFTLDAIVYENLEDKNLNPFILRNIISKNWNGQSVQIEVYTSNGLMSGFFVSDNLESIDPSTIAIESLYVKHSRNDDIKEVRELFLRMQPYSKILDLSDSFRITIQEKDFFTVKALGDGSYLAIDKGGCLYELTHDPFLIQLKYGSLDSFLESLKGSG
jgi:hypothetical protein